MAALEAEIADLIRESRAMTGRIQTIGTVESATGGRVADRITNTPGSSGYFKGSVVAYHNEVKIGLLQVKKSTIEDQGAVSEQTALEMAQGGRKLLDVDICISDTGIAGPAGGAPDKPVGLFYLALAAEDTASVQRHVFTGNREENKRDAAEAALDMLRQYLLMRLEKSGGAA